jgi:hypothetical protein
LESSAPECLIELDPPKLHLGRSNLECNSADWKVGPGPGQEKQTTVLSRHHYVILFVSFFRLTQKGVLGGQRRKNAEMNLDRAAGHIYTVLEQGGGIAQLSKVPVG